MKENDAARKMMTTVQDLDDATTTIVQVQNFPEAKVTVQALVKVMMMIEQARDYQEREMSVQNKDRHFLIEQTDARTNLTCKSNDLFMALKYGKPLADRLAEPLEKFWRLASMQGIASLKTWPPRR